MRNKTEALKALAGQVELLAGGPPCQGFSVAGRRRRDDPRNGLVGAYVELVSLLRPKLVLMENVRGFTAAFKCDATDTKTNFATEVEEQLSRDYDVATAILRASDFGVPQLRPRFILVGAAKDLGCSAQVEGFFEELQADAGGFLNQRGLSRVNTSRDAISDLEVMRNGTVASPDTTGFEATGYKEPKTAYQRAMHDGCIGSPSDLRLARHRESTTARFEAIIEASREEGRLNVTVSPETKRALGDQEGGNTCVGSSAAGPDGHQPARRSHPLFGAAHTDGSRERSVAIVPGLVFVSWQVHHRGGSQGQGGSAVHPGR